jgi:signal transduction histidine kinase
MQIESQEAERKRLAAELHDGLGQNLLLASNEIQQFLNNGSGSREELQQAGKLLEDSIRNVREMSANLHPHQLDRLGFCSALSSMIEAISHASGLKIHHQCGHIDGMLPKESEMHLYRIIQEALSNVVHHAAATNAWVTIQKRPKQIDVKISDDGKGFDPENISSAAPAGHRSDGLRGFGLSSMTERARIIGGRLSIDPRSGGGTTLSFSFLIHQDSPWTSRHASS